MKLRNLSCQLILGHYSLGFFSQGCGHFSSTLEFLSARLEFIPSYTTDDKTVAAHVEISTSREVASF